MKVRQTAIAVISILSSVLGLDPHALRLHREDPLTTHACPGATVRKLEIIQSTQDSLVAMHAGEHPIKPMA